MEGSAPYSLDGINIVGFLREGATKGTYFKGLPSFDASDRKRKYMDLGKVCIYHICVYICKSIYIYIYTYAYTCILVCIYIYIYVCTLLHLRK